MLEERICMLGTALDKIDSKELAVEVFPNRPDMLSVEGFARALSVFIGIKKGFKEYKVKKTPLKVDVDSSVKSVRPFIKCAVMRNVNLDDDAIKSLMQLQEKLHQTHGRKRKRVAIGVHDFDKIKFPLKYKAVKPDSYSFIPLGDKRKLTMEQILKRTPKGEAYAWILEGKKEYPIIVDAADNVVSFPPIINGILTQVTDETRNIFIDVTGTDELAVSQALNIIALTIADRGGIICSVKTGRDITPDLKPSQMPLDIPYANKMLSLNLKESDIKNLLSKMGIGYKGKKALIPAYRVDILHQMDLVEDIAVAYGYENFEPEFSEFSTTGEEDKREIFFRHVSEILVGLGFLETSTCHLTNYNNIKMKMNCDIGYIELANSVSSDYYILRPWLLPSLIKVLSENKNRELPHKIFEIATVFSPNDEEETRVSEKKMLSIAIASTNSDFTKIKQVAEALLSALGVKYSIDEGKHQSFISGRIADIIVSGKKIGFMGEISPQVLSNWEIETPVCALEIDMESIYSFI
ncbi:MAG: phenylalanine--tRNA ligase subunit beta [Candidatus Woesearchaeota archaeon]|nr:phenylalanine--tRNA ligase subunit beta [Candidatus Woesearchaeota archaeon]